MMMTYITKIPEHIPNGRYSFFFPLVYLHYYGEASGLGACFSLVIAEHLTAELADRHDAIAVFPPV